MNNFIAFNLFRILVHQYFFRRLKHNDYDKFNPLPKSFQRLHVVLENKNVTTHEEIQHFSFCSGDIYESIIFIQKKILFFALIFIHTEFI